MSDAAKFDDTPDFSLVLGGPLYQLFPACGWRNRRSISSPGG